MYKLPKFHYHFKEWNPKHAAVLRPWGGISWAGLWTLGSHFKVEKQSSAGNYHCLTHVDKNTDSCDTNSTFYCLKFSVCIRDISLESEWLELLQCKTIVLFREGFLFFYFLIQPATDNYVALKIFAKHNTAGFPTIAQVQLHKFTAIDRDREYASHKMYCSLLPTGEGWGWRSRPSLKACESQATFCIPTSLWHSLLLKTTHINW